MGEGGGGEGGGGVGRADERMLFTFSSETGGKKEKAAGKQRGNEVKEVGIRREVLRRQRRLIKNGFN